MKSIIIPVDFSESSLNSCKYGIEICRKDTPVNLWIFHVYADQMIYLPSYDIDGVLLDPVVDLEFFEEMKKVSSEKLKNLKTDVENYIEENGLKNISVNSFMVQGTPEWTITDVCGELNPDVIVMSTRGSGNKAPFEGRMSKKIMEKVKVPVIAVPDNYTHFNLKRIMYVAHNNEGLNDVGYIKYLVDRFEFKAVDFIIAYFESSKSDELSFKDIDKEFNVLIKKGKINVLKVDKGTDVKNVVEQNKVDMIAFVAYRENIFKLLFKKGVSKEDLFDADVPVLGLPHEFA